jgi:hypothetical protein
MAEALVVKAETRLLALLAVVVAVVLEVILALVALEPIHQI